VAETGPVRPAKGLITEHSQRMKKLCGLILLGGLVLPSASRAIDFKQAKFTQVVNNVEVISPDKARHSAAVNDVFKLPDVLRTGPASRAELVADDNTITRVGANTVFSFDPASRTIDLQQGSLLFHSPHGKGGGTIHTGSATASVLGTTVIVTTTLNGGFKVLVLEGEAEIRFLNGLHINLMPGQMTFILPGGGTSPVVVFRLDQETGGSLLVKGFNDPLPSWPKIKTEITRQLLLLLNNNVQDTDLIVGDNATPNAVQVRMDLLKGGPQSPFDTDGQIIGTDHTPHQPLPVDYPPLNPAHVEKGSFSPPNIPSFSEGLEFLGIVNPVTGGSPASGFVGNNVDIDTANVDLSSFADKPDFDIMAAKDLRIWQSVNFTPSYNSGGGGGSGGVDIGGGGGIIIEPLSLVSGQPDTIALFAGGQMLIAPDSTLEADTDTFGLVADSFGTLNINDGTVDIPNMLLNVSIYNNVGDVDILSLSDLTVEGMNSDYTVYAGGDVDIQSDGSLTLGTDDTISQLDSGHNVAIDAGGSVYLDAQNDLNLYDTEVEANGGDVNLNSYGGNINVEDFSYLDASGTVSLDADGNVYVDNSRLQAGEEGDADVYASGDIGIYTSTIDAGGKVDIEADGTLTIGQDPSHDVSITAGGDVMLLAGGDVSIYDTYIDAGGDVDISSGGTISLGVIKTISGGGNIDVEVSDIYAGDNGSSGQASFTGGSVNINAYNGNVTLNGDDIHAYSGESGAGDVNVKGKGTVVVEDTYIYADGDVNIESGDTLTLGLARSDEIDAYGSVSLTSDNADVHVDNYDIYAYGGDIRLTADNGAITVGNSTLAANGSVYLSANGDIDINNDSVLSATTGNAPTEGAISGDEVSISSGGTVTINGNHGDNGDFDYDIGADTKVFISGSSKVDISDAVIKTLDGSSLDTVEIDSGGDVTLDSTDISSAGDVNINSGGTTMGVLEGTVSSLGNVVIEDGSDVNAGGSFNVNAAGNIDITYSAVEAADSAYLTAGGYVNIYDVSNDNFDDNSSDTYLTDWNITAGSYVDIGADENVQIYNSDIEADDGDVDITSKGSIVMAGNGTVTSGGNITIANSYIQAWDSVNVTADNGSVLIYDGSTLYAENGDVNVTATGNLNVSTFPGQNSIVEANGSVYLSADGDININDLTISATAGNKPNGESAGSGDEISISSGGTVTVWGNYGNNYIRGNYLGYDIGADTTVFIQGSSEVDIYDAVIKTLDGNSLDTVEIDSGGPIYLGSDTIDSHGGVTVSGGGNVTLDRTDINSGGNVNINSGGVVVGVLEGTVSSLGNVVIEDYSDVNAGGSFNVNAGGNIDITYSAVEVGDSANLTAGGNVNLYDVYNKQYDDNSSDLYMDGWNVIAGTDVDLGADKSVQIYNSDIEADGGHVNINAYDSTADIENTHIYASGNVSIESWDTLTLGHDNGDTIRADGNISLISENRDLDVENSSVEAAGSVALDAAYNASIYDTSLLADGGDLIVNAGGELSIDETGIVSHPVTGNNVTLMGGRGVTISHSTITAVDGDLTINAGGGNEEPVFVGKHSIPADSHFSPSVVGGDVDITAGSGNVNIAGDGAIFPIIIPAIIISQPDIDEESKTITDPGSIDLTAVDTATINNSTFTAQGGHVGISGGGAVHISRSSINADAGYADITSSGSTVDIEGSHINASGDVNVESSDTLTLGNTTGNTIDASGAVSLKSDNGDADVYKSYIYSYGANGTSISAAGNVNLGSDNIYSYGGKLSITALGTGSTVDIEGTYIYAGGNVNVESSDTLKVGFTTGNTIQANGVLSLKSDTSDVDVHDYTIYSYGANSTGISTGISAAGNVNLGSDNIYSYGGKLSIIALGTSSTVDIEDTYIYAGSDVKVESGGTLTLNTEGNETIEAGGSVYLTSDSSDADVYNYRIIADNGEVTLNAVNGNIDLEGSYVEAHGSVNLTGYGEVYLDNNSIYADTGDINISSEGIFFQDLIDTVGIDIENSTLYAYDGGVSINANGNVYLYDNDIEADSGNLDINSHQSTIDIEDTYLYASGDVNIASSDTLTLGDNVLMLGGFSRDTIEADGAVYLESSRGDVDIYKWGVYAYGGQLRIKADIGNVDIENSTLGAGSDSNVSISSSPSSASKNVFITANGGKIDISAGNDLTILNTSFELGGNISISDSTITANDGDMDITAGGTLSISAGGTENISGNEIFGDNIDISGSTITANNGNVNIENNGGYSLPDGAGFDLSSAFNVKVSGGSTITANSGNVKISTAGIVDLDSSTVSASGSAGTTGNVTVNAGAGITVNGTAISGDVTAGTIALNNTSGQTTIQNGSSMRAFYISVNSPDGILIDGTSGGHISGNTMNLTAGMGDASGGPTITVQNEDLGNLSIVNVQSHTVNLDNDNLSSLSQYYFTSFYHGYHIGDGDLAGYVNFNNDTLDHTTPITSSDAPGTVNPNNNGGIVLGGSGTGIHIN
jgi:hypothetical protein